MKITRKEYVYLVLGVFSLLCVSLNASNLGFLDDLKDEFSHLFEEYSHDDPENRIVIRKDLLDAIKKLKKEELYKLSYDLERKYTKDDKEAMQNVDKLCKEKMIEHLRKRYKDKPELKDTLAKLEGMDVNELRKLVNDLENMYYPQTAKENIEKAVRKSIIDYINLRYKKDKVNVEKFLEEYLKKVEDKEEQKPEPFFIGGLHDYVATLGKEQLMDVCLALTFHHRKETGDKTELTGFKNKPMRMTEHDLREYLIKECEEHHIQTAAQIKELLTKYMNKPLLNKSIPYLHKLTREDLMKLALYSEKVHKISLGQEKFIGGLHDYVWRLPEDEIRKIIVQEMNEHPQELTVEKFESLLTQERDDKTATKENNEITLLSEIIDGIATKQMLKRDIKIKPSIKSIIRFATRRDLIKILTTLLFEIKFEDEEMLKDLNLDQMSNGHLRKFVKNLIRTHSEELNKEELFVHSLQ